MVLQLPEPDAVEQAVHAAHLVPTDASQADVDRAREWERKIREDHAKRISKELHRQGYEYPARVAEYTSTDPGW